MQDKRIESANGSSAKDAGLCKRHPKQATHTIGSLPLAHLPDCRRQCNEGRHMHGHWQQGSARRAPQSCAFLSPCRKNERVLQVLHRDGGTGELALDICKGVAEEEGVASGKEADREKRQSTRHDGQCYCRWPMV